MLRWVLVFLLALSLRAQSQEELSRQSQLAKSYMASGRFAEAAGIYATMCRALPNNPGLLLNHGMALHLSGQDLAAVTVLSSALKLDPKIPPALLFLGASYLRLNRPADALSPLRQFLALDPDHVEARQMIIDAANLSGRSSEALPHLEALSRLQKDRPSVWYELGRAYEAVAAAAFEQLSKSYPESGPFFALLAESRSQTSQARAAFFFYRKALEKGPPLPGLHSALAAIYRQTGHPDWAAQEESAESRLPKPACTAKSPECEMRAGRYSAALQLTRTPKSSLDYYWRVQAANQLARQAFAALASLPPSPEAFRFQAETLRNQSKFADSATAWQKALELAPGHPDLLRELAATLLAARRTDEAQKVLTPLLQAEPDAPDLNQIQGDILLDQQLADQAIPFLQKTVRTAPANLPARASLARALIQAGRPADALPHATAALPLDTDGSLHFQLARAYRAAGQTEAAQQVLAKYKEYKARTSEQDRVIEEEVRITPPSP